jgi:porin
MPVCSGRGDLVAHKTLIPLAALLLAMSSAAIHPIWAQDATAPAADPAGGPQLHAQTQAVPAGPAPITLRLQYTGELGQNAIGGLRDGTSYMNNILAQLHVSTERTVGWTGGNLVLEAFYENNTSLGETFVGALQDPSVIDSGGAMFRIYQAYYKQDIGDTNLLFGIYDLETEFGATRPMDIFFNGAYAWTTTLDHSGINGPSTYPNTSLAFRVRQKLFDHWTIQAAILDGVPDSAKFPSINAVNINRTAGALLIGEVAYQPIPTTKIMAGYWNYTGKFVAQNQMAPDGTPRQVFGDSGGYIGGTTRLYSQTARRGLDVFANVGIASSEVQQVDRSLSVGMTYTGLLDVRPSDRLGFAVGIAHASAPYRDMVAAAGAGAKSYETNFELTYRARITDWLTVQPDIQYWINPNMDPTLKNDLLFLFHFEISHVFDF